MDVSTLRCDPYPGDGLKLEQPGPVPSKARYNNSGFIHSTALASIVRGITHRGTIMSEPIAPQFISRRRLFWLAAVAASIAAPATMLSASDALAQQNDQAPAAAPAAPKAKENKKKAKKKNTTPPASNPPDAPKQQ
jgi:hypothetical protein